MYREIGIAEGIEEGDEDILLPSLLDEIAEIVEQCVLAELDGARAVDGDNVVDPSLLLDNSHILAKSGLYEQVIERRMNTCKSKEETKAVQKADLTLRGFVLAERKSRARLKLNYVLAGASSNRLDYAINVLAESEEIDEELLRYIDSLIKTELVRKAGPVNSGVEDIATLKGTGKAVIDVLSMIRKRLEAELRMASSPELRLLGALLSEPDAEAREKILRSQLQKVEDLENFAAFLESGIEYISSSDAPLMNPADADRGSSEPDEPSGSEPDLTNQYGAADQLEQMKDILLSVTDQTSMLKTGLREQEIYSTSGEDYYDMASGAGPLDNSS